MLSNTQLRSYPEEDFPKVEGYTVLRKLGQGGGGEVFEAFVVGTEQETVAIKRVSLTKNGRTKTERNVQLHEKLKGVNLQYVVQVFAILDDKVWQPLLSMCAGMRFACL